MKLTLDKETLLAKVSRIIGFVPKKTVIPIYDMFLFEVKDGMLNLFCSNTEMMTKIWMPVDDSECGDVSFCIPAKMLVDILKLFRNPIVDIELFTDDKEVIITAKLVCGNGEYKMGCAPADNFIIMEPPATDFEVSFIGGTIKSPLEYSWKFIDEENMRANLRGICIAEKDNQMMFYGSDGFCIAKNVVKPNSINTWAPISISPNVASAIYEMVKDKEVVDFRHDKKKIIVDSEEFVITAVTLDVDYPDIERFFKPSTPYNVKFNTLEMTDALKRLRVCAGNAKGCMVVINIENEQIHMSAKDLACNNFGHEMIEAKGANPMRIGFQIGYLLNVLSCIDEDMFVFSYTDWNLPGFIKPFVADGPVTKFFLTAPLDVGKKEKEEMMVAEDKKVKKTKKEKAGV